MRNGTAVQISTYPGDVAHFAALLPHHIRTWGSSVDRIVVTIDTHRARAGRYRGSNYDSNLAKLRRLVLDARASYPALESVDVDYSPAARGEVARYFFGRDMIPAKAWDGGYFHSFFYGLYSAGARLVMHFDGDMMFGGGSGRWIDEADRCMEARPDLFLVAPFAGPPRADGRIFGHAAAMHEESLPFAYRHDNFSSRAFLIDMNKFKSRLGHFPWSPTSPKQRLKAVLLGHEPQAIEAEVLISRALQSTGTYRLDLLGAAPGMWSLHPPFRSDEFYRRLPEFIRRVETGDVPDGQRGHYDLNDTIIDWSSARAANRWHRRYIRMARDRFSSLTSSSA